MADLKDWRSYSEIDPELEAVRICPVNIVELS
jgi:hypothetical protein